MRCRARSCGSTRSRPASWTGCRGRPPAARDGSSSPRRSGKCADRRLRIRLGLRRLPLAHERADLVEQALAVGDGLFVASEILIEPGAGHKVLELADGLLLLADALLQLGDARLELAQLALARLAVPRP